MTTNAASQDGSSSRRVPIPVNILQSDQLSPTSLARDCFVNQQFSRKLQAYLVGYVNQIFSNYPVFR